LAASFGEAVGFFFGEAAAELFGDFWRKRKRWCERAVHGEKNTLVARADWERGCAARLTAAGAASSSVAFLFFFFFRSDRLAPGLGAAPAFRLDVLVAGVAGTFVAAAFAVERNK